MGFASFRLDIKKASAGLMVIICAVCAAAALTGNDKAGSIITTTQTGLVARVSATDASGGAEFDDLGDVGGEFDSGEYDGELAVPANISLEPLTVSDAVFRPLDSARVSSLFGYRKNPVTGKYAFHSGYDLAAPKGTEIHAMYSGTVSKAEFDSGYGNYIIIDHTGDLQTLYAHCSELIAQVGDEVGAGDTVALVGSTGNSTGAHLHVEFRREGKRFDPEWILGGMY